MTSRSIIWFRRDLRLADNPALLKAMANSEEIVPVFILDEKLIGATGDKRLAYLGQSLRALDQSLGNSLHVMIGDPVDVLKQLKAKYSANSVHISAEYEPYGFARDVRVEDAGISLTRTGTPYAIAPGSVVKPSDGTAYKVFTPFFRAWCNHGWKLPTLAPKDLSTVVPSNDDRNFPDWPIPFGAKMHPAGELAAHARWRFFQDELLNNYHETRNLAGIDGTSRLSAHLKWGEVHPRILLAGLGDSDAHLMFRKELAWREFYADVLHCNPETNTNYYNSKFSEMRYDAPGEKLELWKRGKTGFPFVDAAMRQLLAEGWMHNRTRMVVASFLVKDLHLEWQLGADFFAEHLVDFDVASNAHGWQWTAGCGTDASPYYRVFNPVEQGKRFDGNGDYVRKYVPELAHLAASHIHEPWEDPDGYKHNYPSRIIDHATERLESLARLDQIKIRRVI